jgi:hypothetical protein
MAGNQNSGGNRPTAPQNNMGISATGGAGSKDGQPNRYISGGTYGEGQALMQQQQSAPMSAGPAMAQGTPMGTLLDPTDNPSEPITAGVNFGKGPGEEVLPKNISADTRTTDNLDIIKKYFPAMSRASQLQDAPDSYKRFLSYLASEISG